MINFTKIEKKYFNERKDMIFQVLNTCVTRTLDHIKIKVENKDYSREDIHGYFEILLEDFVLKVIRRIFFFNLCSYGNRN